MKTVLLSLTALLLSGCAPYNAGYSPYQPYATRFYVQPAPTPQERQVQMAIVRQANPPPASWSYVPQIVSSATYNP